MVSLLDGRTALVTGAASGIGRATVHGFLREGARIIAADRDEGALRREYSGVAGVYPVAVDVAVEDAPTQLVAAAEEHFGGLDILVNNAGTGGSVRPIYETTDEDWHQTVSVNLTSVYRITRDFVPLLKRSGHGRVINTASVASAYAISLLGIYAATKHGVLGLTKAFALELGQFGITVNCVEPANVVTGSRSAFGGRPPVEIFGRLHLKLCRRGRGDRVSLDRLHA